MPSSASRTQPASTGSLNAKERLRGEPSAPIDAAQLSRLLEGLTALRDGNFRKRLQVPHTGVTAELAAVFNEIADRQQHLALELVRVHRVAGREGKYTERLDAGPGEGSWAKCVDAANGLVADLVRPAGELARVVAAVSEGDLTRRMDTRLDGQTLRGDPLRLARSVNALVDHLSSVADEITRVCREVGIDGKLGGQARVRGAEGSWLDLLDAVNTMSSRLTAQVRDIALVTTAVANGDLSRTVTVEASGELAQLKDTVGRMVDQLSWFAAEVTRVAREVGTEGRLGGRADVRGVNGTWRDLAESVNSVADNLTAQVRDIAQVTTAVARGDLSQKITVDVKGELAELKNTVNVMVDQLSSFADEVTRVAREVGGEGRLGGQAAVPGVSGTWRDLTDSVNFMAGTLTAQVRNIAEVTTAVASGDLTRKITVDARGEILELKSTVNTMVDQLSAFADEVTRVAREVGTEGMLGGQARVPGVAGTWRDLTFSVNSMASNLTNQVRNIATVSAAVARGDLSQKISIEARGEVAALAGTINAMVDTLRAFADEVTRVAREVGTEGILGGQAHVRGVAGTWKDLTESVNSMAGNLTSQVRSIALVTTAVAHGDLTQKTYVDARGEILELRSTVNRMVDQLSSFADEVTRVAREVGTEGRLGGQAEVADVSGTWRKLTENVNQLAGTLTTQLRAIAEVSTAVAQGDLSRQITVEAQGEVAELKDNLNQMIDNLRETTRANQEQDWLKTNLARFTGHMQGGRDLLDVTRLVVTELTPLVGASQGSIFLNETGPGGEDMLRRIASYGYRPRKDVPATFAFGEGLVGQVAVERRPIQLTNVPGDYIRISSGLGEAPPVSLIMLPIVFEEQVLGVVELASLKPFSTVHIQFLEQLMEIIGVSLNAIIASATTRELLVESQRLAAELQEKSEELQTQQVELQQTNAQLEEKASLLSGQNRAIEIKNLEIEDARRGLEDRAEQLALSSRYKSEFLANMSHELRTPLNSLLILAKLLSENAEGNLDARQVEFCRTIHGAGTDLMQLINDILDLSKVEAGKMDVHPADVAVAEVVEYVEATFRPLTTEKDLRFSVSVAEDVAPVLYSDQHRLQQVLRNLLSNALKFTTSGEVTLEIRTATEQRFASAALAAAEQVVAFRVTDSGVGIPPEQLRVIFEAFQQADGTISRKFGGTGLGLSISREIAGLIGGEIHVESQPGSGSSFTLYVPLRLESETVSKPAQSDTDPAHDTDPRADVATPVLEEVPPREQRIADDDGDIDRGDKVLLAALTDLDLLAAAVDLGRSQGFKVLATALPANALLAARHRRPAGMIVGMDLLVSDGSSLLQALKVDSETRHIPTVAVQSSVATDDVHVGRLAGALTIVEAPVTPEGVEEGLRVLSEYVDRTTKSLLVVTGDTVDETAAVVELFGTLAEVELQVLSGAEEALAALAAHRFDTVVVDLRLPSGSGFDVIRQMRSRTALSGIPVIVSTGQGISRRDETRLRHYARAMVVKQSATAAQLIDQVALFLHLSDAEMFGEAPAVMERLRGDDRVFLGRRVLIVDDDVRNVFALTSALEQHGVDVAYAENGEEGIGILESDPEVDLVLMDVMMPGMDGYSAIREIRRMPSLHALPVVALTAQAMPGDRENSLAAGASDHITKPVDVDRLLTLLRGWLP